MGRLGVGGSVWVENVFTLFFSVGQEELAVLRRQLEGKDGEMRRLQDETSYKSIASSGAEPTERGGKDFCHLNPSWRACPVLDVAFIYILNLTEWFFFKLCLETHQTSILFFHNSLSCLVSHPDETLRKRLKEKRKGGLCFCSLLHFTTALISTLVCMNEHEPCELCLSIITHQSANT